LNELFIPDFMQVAGLSKPPDLDQVPALIVAPPHMQGLVDVSDEMHQEPHGNDFLLGRGVGVTEHPGQTLDSFDDITRGILWCRLVGFVIPDIHIMPGSGIVPRRISADFVRPGADLREALRAEQGLELLTGLGREMLFGNAPDNAVPDRTPWRGAGSGQQEETKDGRRNDVVPLHASSPWPPHGQFPARRYPACCASASVAKVTRLVGRMALYPGQPSRW